jgi:hypothetical protein
MFKTHMGIWKNTNIHRNTNIGNKMTMFEHTNDTLVGTILGSS